MSRVPYNKLLTNLACSSRTGEYWPSDVFVRMRGRTVTTSGQYSPVRLSRSVSKRLIFSRQMAIIVYLYIARTGIFRYVKVEEFASHLMTYYYMRSVSVSDKASAVIF